MLLTDAKAKLVRTLVPVLNRSFVSVYKVVGFVLLGCIVSGMALYLATTGFYFLNTHWVVPSILSPDNDKVIQATLAYVEKAYHLKTMESEFAEMKKEAEHLKFSLALHRNFQKNFAQALLSEHDRYRKELADLGDLAKDLNIALQTKDDATKFQERARREIEEQFRDGVIDRSEYLKSRALSFQFGSSRAAQTQRVIDMRRRSQDLTEGVAALEHAKGIKDDPTKDDFLALATAKNSNVDILLREQALYTSAIAGSEIEVKIQTLEQKIASLERILADYQETMKKLKESPFVRASEKPVTVAFVPYDNLPNVTVGGKVYGCYLEFIFCKRVGAITGILGGELTARHPLNSREIRGQLIEIAVDGNLDWAQNPSLIIKRLPFLL